jgi:hypothetical protein
MTRGTEGRPSLLLHLLKLATQSVNLFSEFPGRESNIPASQFIHLLLYPFASHVMRSGFRSRLEQNIRAMTEAALIGRQVVSRYFFGFEINSGQLATALFTINKHWAPLWLHGRTPIVSVVSYLILFSRAAIGSVNKVGRKHAQRKPLSCGRKAD